MSYRYDEKQNGLQPGDIKGAVLLYGPRANTRRFATASGDDLGEAPADATRGRPFGIGDAALAIIPQGHRPPLTRAIPPNHLSHGER